MRRAALALAALGLAACGRPADGPRNAILISIDTLRADHLGCYGHPRPTSPRLDAFAAAGVLFEDASSTAPWTLPAHASLLTGLLPSHHRVRLPEHVLPRDVPTLATWLRAAGFDTAAFVNSTYLQRGFGFGRGFATFRDFPEDNGPVGAAGEIVDAARTWLAAPRERPFFLFLHFYDVHSDYRSQPEIERLFAERASPDDGSTAQLMDIAAGRETLDAQRAAYLARLYDGGIRQLDGQLGRLLEAVDAAGRRRDTLVVVTSDHGEEFGRHGGVLHGQSHHREQLQVPLLLRGPGLPAGRRVAEPVSLVDVAPTILDVLGLALPEGLDGRSLRGRWAQDPEPAEPRSIIAETGPVERRNGLLSLRRGRYKVIADPASGRVALYDVAADPDERHDLAAAEPARARALWARLAARLRGVRAGPSVRRLDPAERERLRALGYLQEEPEPGS